MLTITDIYNEARAEGRTPVSFEIFPPKGELEIEDVRRMASELARLEPDFISVTYSAGGTGATTNTAEVAQLVQDEFGVPVCAHITCSKSTSDEIKHTAKDLKKRGIRNVLALRGDIPKGESPVEFRYAKDLIPLLKDEGLTVGAAAYPEGHIDCEDLWEDIEHMRQKQEAGADFFVTQLSFDNQEIYRFLKDAHAAGITAPIACGIMPFLGKSQIERMVFMCGVSLPSPIVKLLAKHEDDPDELRRAGINYANAQITDLLLHGVDGVHIYTMNQPDIAQANMSAVRHLQKTPE